jgi:peptidoglycan/xylan/chitin deacetylase (PgdA/CDA1 family)
MHRARAWLRRALAYTLYYSGILWLYAAIKLRGRAVALMYHRVLPPGADSFSTEAIVVSPATFARQVAFLRKHFKLLDAEALQRCLAQGRFPNRGCVITFDDGWYDNERHALPILQQHRAPALFFVATGYVATATTFWQEQVTRLLFRAVRSPQGPQDLLRELGLESACTATDHEARRRVREVVTNLKSAPSDRIERLRARLLQLPDSDPAALGDDRFMDWEAVRRLSASPGIYVGSHAHSHMPLTQLGPAGALADMRQAQAAFADQGLPPPALAAYPNGDHDDGVVRAARDAGTRVAFTTLGGYLSPGADPLRLPRVNVSEPATATRAEFMCRILGVF